VQKIETPPARRSVATFSIENLSLLSVIMPICREVLQVPKTLVGVSIPPRLSDSAATPFLRLDHASTFYTGNGKSG